jgi:dihydrolipoamide dehydrogenase
VEVLLEARRAREFGLEIGSIKASLPQIMARKRKVVDTLVSGVEQLMKANRIAVHRGTGRVLSPHLVRVDNTEITARKIIVASGSESSPLPVDGRHLPGVLTTDEILELEEIPESLAVIGGSHVGVEFATIFSALGTKVTIVKRRPLLLEPVDEEIGRRFAQTLSRQGIRVIIGAAVKAIAKAGAGLRVVWDTSDGEQGIEAQMVLMATGRRPYTEGLGLSELGVEMEGGAVGVNEGMETNVDDVYAIGDVLGQHMLAHVASYEGEIAAENALGGRREADYRAVPSCVYTFPVVAGVGMTEKEAKAGAFHTRSANSPSRPAAGRWPWRRLPAS